MKIDRTQNVAIANSCTPGHRRSRLAKLLLTLIVVLGFAAGDASAYYNARMGRFMQRDPGPSSYMEPDVIDTQYVDGMSMYEYVDGAPLIHSDPTGELTVGIARTFRAKIPIMRSSGQCMMLDCQNGHWGWQPCHTPSTSFSFDADGMIQAMLAMMHPRMTPPAFTFTPPTYTFPSASSLRFGGIRIRGGGSSCSMSGVLTFRGPGLSYTSAGNLLARQVRYARLGLPVAYENAKEVIRGCWWPCFQSYSTMRLTRYVPLSLPLSPIMATPTSISKPFAGGSRWTTPLSRLSLWQRSRGGGTTGLRRFLRGMKRLPGGRYLPAIARGVAIYDAGVAAACSLKCLCERTGP